MQQGKQLEPIYFDGNGMKLFDIKKIVFERKFQGSISCDFDLNVTDHENQSKVYVEEEEIIPKNSSLVFKRKPVNRQEFSILWKINHRGSGAPSTQQNSDVRDIVINAREEKTPQPIVESQSDIVEVKDIPAVTDDKMSAYGGAVSASSAATAIPPPLPTSDLQVAVAITAAVTDASEADQTQIDFAENALCVNTTVQPSYTNKGYKGKSQEYSCYKCRQPGHTKENCPKKSQSMGPRGKTQRHDNLDNVDTTNAYVSAIPGGKGYYVTYHQKKSGMDHIVSSNVNLAEFPMHLKCAWKDVVLHEPVMLPCCKKVNLIFRS